MENPSSQRWSSRRGLTLLSGALLGISYLPAPLLVLNLTALVPLMAQLDGRPTSGYDRLKTGVLFGIVTYAIGLHFMYSMLAFSWLASLLYVFSVLAFALRVGVIVAVAGWLRQRTRLSWAIILPLCWIPAEWLGTWGDLRVTADHLSYGVARYPFLVQFADLFGPYGIDAVLLATNALVYETCTDPRRRRRGLTALLVLWLAVLSYDTWSWTRPPADTALVRVGLVQPNVPFAVKHDRATDQEQWETLERLSRDAAAAGAELIVWPESARPGQLHHWLDRPESFHMADVEWLARDLGVAFIVGVEYARVRTREDYDLYNAALAVSADGVLIDGWTAKVYLVPFTEVVPFENLFGALVEGKSGGQWRWVSGGFDRGPRLAPLDVDGASVGVLVCYEQLFPELPRRLRNAGSQIMAVITNDAWWGRSFFQRYQANALRLRAIENRTAIVRAANTGISGFVDPLGRYHEMTRLYEEAMAVHDLPLTTTRTLYDRIGDAIVWLAVAALAAAVLIARAEGSDKLLPS